jgi:hypothetical protein
MPVQGQGVVKDAVPANRAGEGMVAGAGVALNQDLARAVIASAQSVGAKNLTLPGNAVSIRPALNVERAWYVSKSNEDHSKRSISKY